jgi:SAM-dependent methyltransferase
MSNDIPEFDELVDEITELTGLDRGVVARKVWADALNQTSNVCADARRVGLQPHVYSEQMEAFYRDTDGFIFETMIECCRGGKRAVLADAERRIQNYLQTRNVPRAEVLMFGDGTGSDTSYFHNAFGGALSLSSFDVPGSKTFDFAVRRFKKHRVPVEVITDYSQIPAAKFDIIVSFEVLEHLSDPQQAIHDMARFLKDDGIALITESFEAVIPPYPTHLLSNFQYARKTPLMFLKAGLVMSYFNNAPMLKFRPTEFTKKVPLRLRDRLGVILNRHVHRPIIRRFVEQKFRQLVR